jgi:hypothetical protein
LPTAFVASKENSVVPSFNIMISIIFLSDRRSWPGKPDRDNYVVNFEMNDYGYNYPIPEIRVLFWRRQGRRQ